MTYEEANEFVTSTMADRLITPAVEKIEFWGVLKVALRSSDRLELCKMRLIDADELIEVLEEQKDFYSPNLSVLVNEAMASAFRIAIREAKNAPTADVQEVKHGSWDMDFSARVPLVVCSLCGLSNNQSKTKYCPNCGARMDGDEK